MPKIPITVRIDEDVLLSLKEWMDSQQAPPTLTSAVEAAIRALVGDNK